MGSLEEYRRKRNFGRTPEPAGAAGAGTGAGEGGRFVIQKHAASHLHYDLRLEYEGVFRSWAVPKGPSLQPGDKRLAVQVEDHPLDYGDFEGVIPKGEYGGGTVMLWDRGRWAPVHGKGRKQSFDSHIDFVLLGEKLRGAWTLVRTRGKGGADSTNWLLIKRQDNAAADSDPDDLSVATGRSMQQIAADRNRRWGRTDHEQPGPAPPDPADLPGAKPAPLPVRAEAQLATLAQEAPAGDDWIHEIKFDGYRILARREGDSLQLLSRNGKDWTRRFPEIARLLRKLPGDDLLLDGEVVAFASDGTTSFRGLQDALSSGETAALVYQLFDLPYLSGHDLRGVSLLQRKQTLAALLAAGGFTPQSGLRYTDHIQGQGRAFAEHSCRLGLEGSICKRATARYRAGRSRDWLKGKCTAREELLIGGFTDPSGARSGFGALLLGAWDGDRLAYAGKVGTGFNQRELNRLHARLQALEIETPPFAKPPREKGLHWVEPQLIAEVEFTEWTRDGALRHPTFKGLREDRDPEEITLPEAARQGQAPAAGPGDVAASGRRARSAGPSIAGIRISNPERLLYPEAGISKLALAQYYEEVADWILPQIAQRPLSLLRCPSGYQECFFQKHPRDTLHKSIPRVSVSEKDGAAPYLYVEKLSDIIALVQAGALELHVWGSRVEDLEHPDILVFDLDPAEDLSFARVLDIALELRQRLRDLGLDSFPRTTGGKGLHLVVPVRPERSWEEVKSFCQNVARAHARDNRQRVTSNMAKSRRRGKVFVDYLRNGRGATAIASYSTRARPGATVAVPLAWEELNPALRPDHFSLEHMRRRLAVLREDPWQGFEAARVSLSDAMLEAVQEQ